MRTRVLAALSGILLLVPVCASAAPIALASLVLNVDGATYDSLSGDPLPAALGGASIDASGFDMTTGLGTLTLRLAGVGAHTILGFFDIDLRGDQQFTNDSAGTEGAPAAGQSWEIDNPGGDIIDHAFDTTAATKSLLTNSSDLVGPDDVSMALARDFILNSGDLAFISFTGSEATLGTAAGFRLLAWDDLNTYTLSSDLRIAPDQVEPVPEPGTLLLVGMGCLGIARKLRRRHQS